MSKLIFSKFSESKLICCFFLLVIVLGCKQDNRDTQKTTDDQDTSHQHSTNLSDESKPQETPVEAVEAELIRPDNIGTASSFQSETSDSIRLELIKAADRIPNSKLDELEVHFKADPYYHMKLAGTERKETLPVLLAGMKRRPAQAYWVGALCMFPAADQWNARELAPDKRKVYYQYTLAYLQEAIDLLQTLTVTDSNQIDYTEYIAMLQRPMAQAAMEIGELKLSKQISKDMLLANNEPKSWNYGNVIHQANTILGQIALRESELNRAKHHLIESVQFAGSPQSSSFGPSFQLARELLERGEKEVVIRYLDLVAVFWANPDKETRGLSKRIAQDHATEMEKWKQEIAEGEIPQGGKWR